MSSRFEWTGIGWLMLISAVAVALTAWQAQIDRSVFERYFGPVDPIVAMAAVSVVGALACAHLQASSEFSVLGPGDWGDAMTFIAWVVPLLAAAAIGADLVMRFAEDTNVAMPDALRFYPAIAVFAELALRAIPLTALVAVAGGPSGLDLTFWRLAIPVALIEAVLQAVYATSIGTSVFSAAQLVAFGVVQVWVFWRFGFTSALALRLAYYSLWHVAWGVARLRLLF